QGRALSNEQRSPDRSEATETVERNRGRHRQWCISETKTARKSRICLEGCAQFEHECSQRWTTNTRINSINFLSRVHSKSGKASQTWGSCCTLTVCDLRHGFLFHRFQTSLYTD